MTDSSQPIVQHPETKLEDVREAWGGNECTGRGRSTAAGRGYNTERLARAVLDTDGGFVAYANRCWYDTFVNGENVYSRIECKSCVYRYPSGGYGQFRIWQHHHHRLFGQSQISSEEHFYGYFFVVYEIESGIEKEVGKVLVPVDLVNQALDGWTTQTHQTMGTQKVRDISWHLLVNRLGISAQRLRVEPTVDLTRTESE